MYLVNDMPENRVKSWANLLCGTYTSLMTSSRESLGCKNIFLRIMTSESFEKRARSASSFASSVVVFTLSTSVFATSTGASAAVFVCFSFSSATASLSNSF